MHFEIDLFWAWRGAADPVDLIQRHRGRIRQVHVKDMDSRRRSPTPATVSSTSAGSSQHAREAGLEEYIVERDDAGTPPRAPADALDTARVGFDYLASLRY